VLEHFKHQTLERLGFVTEQTNEMTVKITQRLKSRKSLRWLTEKTIDEEIQQFYYDKNIRLYWGTPLLVHRLVSQKMSAFVLKQCAKEHGIPMTNVRPDDNSLFIVHDFMNPWTLIEEHTAHTAQPEGHKFLWQDANHQEWRDLVSNKDSLVQNMLEQFEHTYSDWLDQGVITRITEKQRPVDSILYQVKTL